MVSSILLVFCFLFFGSCLGWGKEGHQIIAQIAADNLDNSATSLVTEYIGEDTLQDIAPLPDQYDHTSEGRWSAPCHYVNMPSDATQFTMADCPGFCVVKSIQNYTSILQNNENNPTPCDFDDGVEPCALEFLVHFVGDVHQPLHVGYENDSGGNQIDVSFFGQDGYNLHQCWDTEMIERWDDDVGDAVTQLEQIMSENPSVVKKYISDMNPIDWANESFQFVRNAVYNYTVEDGVPQIDQDYYDSHFPIIQQRLIAAGARLGQLLNNILTGRQIHVAKKTLKSLKFN